MNPQSLLKAWALPWVIAMAFFTTGCASKPLTPPQAPPAVKVEVPVPVPCQVAQVAPSGLPTASAPLPTDIFDAVKLILADRATLKADRTRLVAANSNPCPTPETK